MMDFSKFPSFWKEGCLKGGVVGKVIMPIYESEELIERLETDRS